MASSGLGFSSCFDSGNGTLQNVEEADGKTVMKVLIKDDPYTEVDGRAHKMVSGEDLGSFG